MLKTIKIKWILAQLILTLGCGSDSGNNPTITVEARDFRQDMRQFVQDLSTYAKNTNANFAIIPQNGQSLLTTNGESDGPPATQYLAAIDAVGREDLFYGYERDNRATAADETDWLLPFLQQVRDNGKVVMVTDYCSDQAFMDDSYQQNQRRDFISFAADRRDLDNIPTHPPTPFNSHSTDVNALAQGRNFLYLLDPGPFDTKEAYLQTLRNTDYDILLIDAFYRDTFLSAAEVESLKNKANGGQRLVLCYMSIGEAENYRYYWGDDWRPTTPDWLASSNPNWPNNYKVKYWDPAWQAVIFGTPEAYLDRILAAGFDGVYLDIIDAFEFFEEL